MDKRRIAILGSTGSIGRQTLDVIREHRDLFEVEMLTCKGSWELMASQAKEFDANNAVICDETKYKDLADALDGTDTKVFAGMKSVCDLVTSDRVDIVVAAMVGFSGLAPTMAAIGAGKVIALANKETLVAAGSIVMEMSKKYHAPILPVDSEHSAIFQCLLSAQGNAIRKIHLTASGGPFRTWDKERISAATKMNKGFEVIEARWLFDTHCDRINVVVHPESIIHSMIEYEDGSVIAQLACPDMREPIQFAIGFPERLPLANKKLDFAELGGITFFKPDTEKFPALALAYKAMERGGNIPCALNAANEAAVAAYLHDRISFYGITDIVGECIECTPFIKEPSVEDIFKTNEEIYSLAQRKIEGIAKKG